MTHYAWTIDAKGRRPIQKVTTVNGMHDVLRVLDLPGFAPSDLVMIASRDEHGSFTHNEGGDDEWSVTWTKVDDPAS